MTELLHKRTVRLVTITFCATWLGMLVDAIAATDGPIERIMLDRVIWQEESQIVATDLWTLLDLFDAKTTTDTGVVAIVGDPLRSNTTQIMRFNNSGQLSWTRRTPLGNDYVVALGPADELYVGGTARVEYSQHKLNPVPTSSGDFSVIQLDRNGKTGWEKTIGTPLHEQLSGLTRATDGGVVLVGGTKDHPTQVIRLDPNGKVLWEQSVGKFVSGDVTMLPDGQVAVVSLFHTGSTTRYAAGISVWIISINGELISQHVVRAIKTDTLEDRVQANCCWRFRIASDPSKNGVIYVVTEGTSVSRPKPELTRLDVRLGVSWTYEFDSSCKVRVAVLSSSDVVATCPRSDRIELIRIHDPNDTEKFNLALPRCHLIPGSDKQLPPDVIPLPAGGSEFWILGQGTSKKAARACRWLAKLRLEDLSRQRNERTVAVPRPSTRNYVRNRLLNLGILH